MDVMMYLGSLLVGIMLLGGISATGAQREKRDDHYMISVTTIEEEPYVTLDKPRGSGNDNFKGMVPDMMKYITDRLSLQYKFQLVADKKYGTLDGGKWNGMVGELVDKKADMIAAPLTISEMRKNVVDFTEPFEKFGTTLLMLEPEDGSELSIKSIYDLTKQSEIQYGMVKDGNTQSFFKSSVNETYKKIWATANKNQQNLVNNVKTGIDKVRTSNGKYAFIMESATAEYWVNRPPCNLVMVGDLINSNSFAFALHKEHAYKDRINEIMVEMKQNGEMNKLRIKWKKGDCDHKIYMDPISGAPSDVYHSGITRHVALMSAMAAFMSLL